MTVPGVGPVVALTYRATVDVPAPLQELRCGRGGAGLVFTAIMTGFLFVRFSKPGPEITGTPTES